MARGIRVGLVGRSVPGARRLRGAGGGNVARGPSSQLRWHQARVEQPVRTRTAHLKLHLPVTQRQMTSSTASGGAFAIGSRGSDPEAHDGAASHQHDHRHLSLRCGGHHQPDPLRRHRHLCASVGQAPALWHCQWHAWCCCRRHTHSSPPRNTTAVGYRLPLLR